MASVQRIGGIDREIRVDLDPALMAGLGLLPATVSAQIAATQRDASGGQGDIAGARQSARTLAAAASAADLAAPTIPLGDGRTVRLDHTARIHDGAAERTSDAERDGQPVIGMQVTRSKGFSDVTVMRDLRKAFGNFAAAHPEVTLTEASDTVAPIEDNCTGSDQGELQRQGELFSSFGTAMAIGVFCIYAVLVLPFHDFLQPTTILCALPLSLGGALFALLLTRLGFSMPSIIGLLMLMGIVTKNSILLVEYAVMARRTSAVGRLEAVLDACHKRARPIPMTTLAMGAGMLPNAIGLGAEPRFRQPMAVVVIGGLVASTLLSLIVIPVVFTLVDDALQGLRRLSVLPAPTPPQPPSALHDVA